MVEPEHLRLRERKRARREREAESSTDQGHNDDDSSTTSTTSDSSSSSSGSTSGSGSDDTANIDDDGDMVDILITIALLDPEGHYEVILDKTSPVLSPPVIQPPAKGEKDTNGSDKLGSGYLTHRDLQRIQWGIMEMRKVLNTPPMSTVIAAEMYPKKDLEEIIKKRSVDTNNHLRKESSVGKQQQLQLENGELEVGLFEWVRN